MSRVVSFGEILWDKLPSGKVPGGAPLNFAYRLNSFQNSLSIISKVGDDSLGKGLTEFLNKNGLDTEHIQISKIYKISVKIWQLFTKFRRNFTSISRC